MLPYMAYMDPMGDTYIDVEKSIKKKKKNIYYLMSMSLYWSKTGTDGSCEDFGDRASADHQVTFEYSGHGQKFLPNSILICHKFRA